MSRWLSMQLDAPGRPLQQVWREALPQAGPGQVLIKVSACGVCRTDLHIIDGELPALPHPVVPGHEVVGHVVAQGPLLHATAHWQGGERVGVPWLGWTCGECEYCLSGCENLCPQARFTGYQIAGGYAGYLLADARYVLRLPPTYDDVEAAPLLCAGLIGYRAYAKAGLDRSPVPGAAVGDLRGARPGRVGLYGFGAAAHLIAQVAVHQGHEVFALTRSGDTAAQRLALGLGAVWAGGSDTAPPHALDAALIFAPVGALVPLALQAVRPGGIVVCAGIHMSDIPSFPYAWLWQERRIASVANLTRADALAFMRVAEQIKLQVSTHRYALADANQALQDLRQGRFSGAAVIEHAV